MSANNSVSLIGRLGKDPELQYLNSGTAMARFSLAVDRFGKKEDKKEPIWVNCSVYGTSAEAAANFLGKGRLISIEGRLDTFSYEKDGEKRNGFEIKVSDWKALDFKKDDGGAPADDAEYQEEPAVPATTEYPF